MLTPNFTVLRCVPIHISSHNKVYLVCLFAACPSNRYGRGCVLACTCQNGAACNSVNGICTCQQGFFGTDCENSKFFHIVQIKFRFFKKKSPFILLVNWRSLFMPTWAVQTCFMTTWALQTCFMTTWGVQTCFMSTWAVQTCFMTTWGVQTCFMSRFELSMRYAYPNVSFPFFFFFFCTAFPSRVYCWVIWNPVSPLCMLQWRHVRLQKRRL